ncbi:MAG TPA: hypothetical protein PKU77_15385, partial [Ferruginibacter sp.]|nr:hypothetical protein [Ferruginibacter sp.]
KEKMNRSRNLRRKESGLDQKSVEFLELPKAISCSNRLAIRKGWMARFDFKSVKLKRLNGFKLKKFEKFREPTLRVTPLCDELNLLEYFLAKMSIGATSPMLWWVKDRDKKERSKEIKFGFLFNEICNEL